MFDTLEAPAERLVDVVDALLATPSVDLPPVAALDRLGTVLVQGERLTVVALDGVADLEHRELFALDGAGSAVGWLRARRVGGDPRLRAFARHLSDRPVVREALVAGRLGTDAALKVCTALGSVPFEASESDLTAVLTDGARQVLIDCTAGGACAADLARLDQLSTDSLRRHRRRAPRPGSSRCSPSSPNGSPPPPWPGTCATSSKPSSPHCSKTPTTRATTTRAWTCSRSWTAAGTSKACSAPRPAPPWTLSSPAGSRPCPKTPNTCRAWVSAAPPPSASSPATAPAGTATDQRVPPPTSPSSSAPRPSPRAAGALPARLSDGTRTPATTAQRLGCDGRLSVVITDALGHALHASGTHRNATQRERRALHAQWGGCAIDGCTEPFAHTRPHHVIPWWLSKITRLKDLAPLCPHHHHDIHEGQRTLRLRDSRHIGPTGWIDPA